MRRNVIGKGGHPTSPAAVRSYLKNVLQSEQLVCALNFQIYCCPMAFIDCPYFIISIIMAVSGRVTFVARLTRVNRGHMPEGARQDKGYEDVERDEELQ